MKRIVFEDTPAFYRQLKALVDQGEEVEILTHYERYSDVPDKLKKLFELHKHQSPGWVHVNTGAFAAGAVAPVGFNSKVLYVLVPTVIGAGIGVFFGGVGAVVGAGVGATAGVVAYAITGESNVEVKVEITVDGKLKIHIVPKGQGA